ncbi:hypothetical protein H2204_009927 [Knufia peltigerae]|uniref:Uncharacterized protein n=1 Tax=Knufia peltigerae TaxID=1002370 RepID=A0AA38XX91_9EURO|nr:hypothetical protein H2204_009927 [Knufia peltigerae]
MADMYWHADLFSEAEDICRELVDAQVSPDSKDADIPFRAMTLLAQISKHKKDYAEAVFWFLRASVGFEKLYGSEDAEMQLLLYHANQLQEKLQYIADSDISAIEQQKSERKRLRAEQVEFAIAQLGKEMSQTGLDTGNHDTGPEGRRWNEDGASTDHEPTHLRGCPINVSKADARFSVNNEQHEFKERHSSTEMLQSCLTSPNGVRKALDGGTEPSQKSSSHFSFVGSTNNSSDTKTALRSVTTTGTFGDNCAGFWWSTREHESASGAQFVESAAGLNPTMNNLYALDPIDWELPVLGDNEDFDDLCRMPYLDQQSEFRSPFTSFDTSNTFDANTTEMTAQVSSTAQIHSEEPLNFDNVVNDSDWLNNFLLPDIQTDSDLPTLESYPGTTVMEYVDWQ